MKKILIVVLIITSIVFSQDNIEIKNKIVIVKATGISFLGSGITFEQAEEISLLNAKRNAMEKAGTYIESHTEVVNYTTTKDEIITATGGLLKISEPTYKKELEGGEFVVKTFIVAQIDLQVLNKRLVQLSKNIKLKKELEQAKKASETYLAELQKLKDAKNKKVGEQVTLLLNLSKAYEYFQKGINAKLNKEYKNAANFYTKAIEFDAKNFKFYNNRGVVYIILNKNKRAEKDFLKSIDLAKGNDYSYYYNIGLLYVKLKKVNKVKKYLKLYLDNQTGITLKDRNEINEILKSL